MEDTMAAPPADRTEGPSGIAWWLMLLEGIVLIALGILFFVYPASTTVAVAFFIAWYWIVTGIIALASIFWDRAKWGWRLFWGIVSIAAGWFVVTNLLVGTATLLFVFIIVLGIQGLVIGLVEIVEAFQGAGWGRGILGAVSALFGLLLLAWNWNVVPVLPWVFGIFALIGGLMAIVAAFMMRSAESTTMRATPAH